MALDHYQLLLNRFGHLPGFDDRGREWHSSCPECGGGDKSDRFFMNVPDDYLSIARGKCRQCDYFEPVLSDDERRNIDSVTRAEWEAEREARHKARMAQINERREELTASGIAIKYHQDMEFSERSEWYRQGIEDPSIRRYRLGYVKDRQFGQPDNRVTTDALTIPFWGGAFEQVMNIQFRLQQHPPKFGKYRPLYGIPVPLFKTMPDEPLKGNVIVGEGAKKVMVLAQHLWAEGAQTNIVAVPSSMPSIDLLNELKDCDVVNVILDPDAYKWRKNKSGKLLEPAINRAAKILYEANPEQLIRLVQVPVKIDDFFYIYGHDVSLLRRFFLDAPIYQPGVNTQYESLFQTH